MPTNYTLNWSSDALKAPFTVVAGTIDTTSTSLMLMGKGVPNWGERLDENSLRLLENFASATAPTAPTYGQFWYDTANQQFKFYTIGGTWEVLWPHPEGVSPAPSPVAPTPVAPTPVAPTPVAPTPVAPTPVAPTPVAPSPTPGTVSVFYQFVPVPSLVASGSNVIFRAFFTGTANATNVPVTIILSPEPELIGPSGSINATVDFDSIGDGHIDFTYLATGVPANRSVSAFALLTNRLAAVTVVSSAITYTALTFAPGPYLVGQSAVATLHFTSSVDQTVTINTVLENPGGGLSGNFSNAIVESLTISGGVGTKTHTVTTTSTGTKTLQGQVYGVTPTGTIRSDTLSVTGTPSPSPSPSSGSIISPPSRFWNKFYTFPGPSSALTWLNIYSDGTLRCMRGSTPFGEANITVHLDNWYSAPGAGVGTGRYVRATLISGSLPNNPSGDSLLNTWIELNGSVSWTCRAAITSSSGYSDRGVTLQVEWSNSPVGATIDGSAIYAMYSECTGNQ